VAALSARGTLLAAADELATKLVGARAAGGFHHLVEALAE
jgi:hypothetical protein